MKDWVQFGATGLVICIFRSKKAAVLFAVNPNRGMGPEPILGQLEHGIAIRHIRQQVFTRDNYQCVHCGRSIIWESGHANSGELHEKQARGDCQQVGKFEYQSGEQSVDNCETRCHSCHTGKGGVQDRSPSFSVSR